MKKLLAGVLMLAMFLSLGFVGGWNGRALADVPEDQVGTYELVELYIDGEDYTEIMTDAGLVFTLELREDGTATLTNGDEVLNMDWNGSAFKYEDGSRVLYEYKDGVLTLEEDDTTMIFKRVDATAETVKTETSDDITGTWVGVVDARDLVAEGSEELGPYLKSAPMAVTLEMNGDGTYTLTIDATTAIPAIKDALRAYVLALCEENNRTQAEFEAEIGQNLDEFVEEAAGQIDLSDGVQTGSGEYTEADGKVVWDPGAEENHGLFTGDFLTFSVGGIGDVVLTRGDVVGFWVGKVDVKDELGEMALYVDSAYMNVYLELKDDGTYEFTTDGASLVPAFREAVHNYVESMCEESNLTVEEFEAQAGMSVEAFVDEILADLDTDEMTEKATGEYTEKDGQLVLDPGTEETIGSFDGMIVTLDLGSDEIILTRAGFLGTWDGYVDITEEMTEGDPEMAEYVKDVKLGITVELMADGSYTMTLDVQPMFSALKSGMRDYLNALAEDNGVSQADLEAQLGMSVDEYLDSFINDIDTDELPTKEGGTYTVKNGRILFDDEAVTLVGGTWSGSTLVFTLEDYGDIVLTRR